MEYPAVRSATVFIPPSCCQTTESFSTALTTAAQQALRLRDALQTSGIVVQTTRVSAPGPVFFGSASAAHSAAQALERAPVDFANLGTVRPTDPPEFREPRFFEHVLRQTTKVFVTMTVSRDDGGVDVAATEAAARTILAVAHMERGGMANMRFAALCNVRAGGPFFPGSYASWEVTQGEGEIFAAALAVQTSSLLHPPHDAMELTRNVEACSARFVEACAEVCPVLCDFSLAPLPGERTSTAAGMCQVLRISRFGDPGTVASAAMVASALDRAVFPRTGYCGIMLAFSEDSALAQSKRVVTLHDLLLPSSVCGVGLDVIPIPGSSPVGLVQRVVMDVAALSTRLASKQLSIRLMPVPGASVGDMTTFDSEYLANGPVLDVGEGCSPVPKVSQSGLDICSR